MKLNILAVALAASAFATLAHAQTTIIQERSPSVVIEKDRPAASVTIEKRDPAVTVEKRVTTGSSADCDTKTVHKEDATGSTTVKKTRCD